MPSCLLPVVPYYYRRGGRRRNSMGLRPIQSYKQINIDGPASRAAATLIQPAILQGVDNYTGPSAANNEVPTGAKVTSFIIFACFTNLVSVSALLHMNVQFLRSGQGAITPGAIGGNAQRNQVVATVMKFLGKDQNSNFTFQVKVPKIYQRIREGDVWRLTYVVDAVFASATQALYKFYR